MGYLIFVAFFNICLAGCYHRPLNVKSIGEPDYPIEARTDGIQGRVIVQVEIGTAGRVIWVKGSGSSPALVEAAEENARRWIFGPFPPDFKFPFYHQITYKFRLEGQPSPFVTRVNVRTRLPNELEITSPPIKPDSTFVRKTIPPKKE